MFVFLGVKITSHSGISHPSCRFWQACDKGWFNLTKCEEYDDYRRGETQRTVNYINMFDTEYRRIEKLKKLPPEMPAFKLLLITSIASE